MVGGREAGRSSIVKLVACASESVCVSVSARVLKLNVIWTNLHT